jgi:hypothetical protein
VGSKDTYAQRVHSVDVTEKVGIWKEAGGLCGDPKRMSGFYLHVPYTPSGHGDFQYLDDLQ